MATHPLTLTWQTWTIVAIVVALVALSAFLFVGG
jgi:hypothetical protein